MIDATWAVVVAQLARQLLPTLRFESQSSSFLYNINCFNLNWKDGNKQEAILQGNFRAEKLILSDIILQNWRQEWSSKKLMNLFYFDQENFSSLEDYVTFCWASSSRRTGIPKTSVMPDSYLWPPGRYVLIYMSAKQSVLGISEPFVVGWWVINWSQNRLTRFVILLSHVWSHQWPLQHLLPSTM